MLYALRVFMLRRTIDGDNAVFVFDTVAVFAFTFDFIHGFVSGFYQVFDAASVHWKEGNSDTDTYIDRYIWVDDNRFFDGDDDFFGNTKTCADGVAIK